MLRAEGYDFVNALFDGHDSKLLENSPIGFLFENPWIFLGLIGVLVFLKAILSSVSLASGADGGIFAPSMFIGAFSGFFVARFLNLLGLLEAGLMPNFIAVGMGGVLAGVMHAPMTGIFLIAEITGGYRLFVPLMIVASLSCYICRKICRYNVYKSTIASQGGTPEPRKETAAMEKINVEKIVEKNFMTVKQNDTLRTLLTIIMKSKRNIFPVIDDDSCLVGLVTLDDIRPFLLNDSLYDVVLVYDVMSDTGPVLSADDSLYEATKLFESCGRWNLPVVKNDKYLGFVSKAGVFDRYRNLLKNKTELF